MLTAKFRLGLFEHPYADRSYAGTLGSAAHRALAREAVQKSQVLLKNAGNLLPLAKTGGKIFVAGKNADDIGNQSGGWTISWQGGSGPVTPGTTILQGIRSAVGSGTTVTFDAGGAGIDGSYRAAALTVRNTGAAAINGWTLGWSFGSDQRVTSAWNATVTQSGSAVTATAAGYNAVIPAAGSIDFGLQGTFGAANPSPAAFTLNGTACTTG